MAQVSCGYKNINLIRRPFKKLATEQYKSGNMRIEELGNFNLIPLDSDSYYNTENQIFPMGDDTGQIYLISDPDVGVLIPHIKKESNYILSYKNIDLDGLFNKHEIDTFISDYRSSLNTDNLSLAYNVSGFIFTQPIFLKESDNIWSVYMPMYKINDDDVKFEKREKFDISSMFDVDSSLEINDVVISNQDIDDMNFSQFGIGKNGLSLRNGISYTVSETGDVNFNIGNIKSDSTPFMKVKMKIGNTSQNIDRKLESESYRKGDVISGTSVTSLISSIFQEMNDKIDELSSDLYICSTDSTEPDKTVDLKNSFPTDGSIVVRLKYKNTAASPYFTYTINGSSNQSIPPKRKIIYNDKYGNDLSSMPAGYYEVKLVKKEENEYYEFTKKPNGLFDKMNTFFKKTSNFDILIVKK